MKRLLAIMAFILFVALPSFAQTISPVVVESGKKVNGSFTVRNDSLAPIFVVIETKSSTYDKNGRHLSPLSPDIHVTLSETSFRLGPQQTEEVSYKGKVDSAPQSFAFLVEMTLGHTKVSDDSQTVQVRLIAPETVYVCQKAAHCRQNTLTSAGLLLADNKK
jgi:hypothetical protein